MSAKRRGIAIEGVPRRTPEIPPQEPGLKVQAHRDTSPDVEDRGVSYMHCSKCLDEWKESFQGITSPKGYARQQISLTEDGIQVWCTRHEINITTIVFRAVRKEAR